MEDFTDELGHDMANATCTEPATCKRDDCNHTEGESLGHSFSGWEVIKEATETEEGEEKRVCGECGETETREIPVKENSSEEDDNNSAGCAGSVSGSIFGLMALCIGTVVLRKKNN